jgi:hypothetical protein
VRAFPPPLFLGLGAALLAGGCRCSEDRPYTPFGTTTALPSAAPSPSTEAAAAPSASAAPVIEKSVLAPAGSRSWELGGQTLAAPPGYVFNQAVRARFGGGDEAVAWLEADAVDAGPLAAGALWAFPSAGDARKLIELPGFVPAGPGCKLAATLARTGPKTVTLDVRGECKGALIARAPLRALVVVAPDAEAPELMSLRVAGPAPGETLELVTTTNDRDGDGRDDVAVEVRVGTSGGGSLGAPFVWLDRPAGRSRDSTEPGRTLLRAAQREAGRAKVKKVAPDVVANVAILRRLMAAACAEGATPRVLDADANPLACGSLAAVVDALATAEVTAELARGHVLDAFGALTRDGWYFGKTSASARQKLERQLFDAVTPATAVVRTLEPRPLLERAPRMSPLAFEPGGALLVLTAGGVVRSQPDGSSPEPLAEASPTRSLVVLAAPGQRFSGAIYACDRSEVILGLEGAPALVTTLLSPRPGACGHAPFFATDVPPILAAGGGQVSAIVGGTAVGNAGTGAPVAGSARSANGRFLIVPTAYGLFIDGPSHTLVNLGTSVQSPLALTDCVVDDSGNAAACVQKGQTLLVRVGTH